MRFTLPTFTVLVNHMSYNFSLIEIGFVYGFDFFILPVWKDDGYGTYERRNLFGFYISDGRIWIELGFIKLKGIRIRKPKPISVDDDLPF